MAEEKLSTAESLRATRTYGQVRCHNPSCTGRITPEPGQAEASCPTCGSAWRIFWVKAGFPRIRGPVWETNRRIADEQFARWSAKKEGV
jgi:hypothetical protein